MLSSASARRKLSTSISGIELGRQLRDRRLVEDASQFDQVRPVVGLFVALLAERGLVQCRVLAEVGEVRPRVVAL